METNQRLILFGMIIFSQMALSGCDEAGQITKIGEPFRKLELHRQAAADVLFYRNTQISESVRLLLPAVVRVRELHLAYQQKKPEKREDIEQLIHEAQKINLDTYPAFDEVAGRLWSFRWGKRGEWISLLDLGRRGYLRDEEKAAAKEYISALLLEMLSVAYQRESEFVYIEGARLASIAFETALGRFDHLKLLDWYKGHHAALVKDKGLARFQAVGDLAVLGEIGEEFKRMEEISKVLREFLEEQEGRLVTAYAGYFEGYK